MSDLQTGAVTGQGRACLTDDLIIETIDDEVLQKARVRTAERVRLLWNNSRLLAGATVAGLVIATAGAFLIPNRYTSSAELMPPDQSGTSGIGMLMGQVGGGLASLAAGELGVKTNGALFIGILKSRTVQDDLIQKFELQKVYKTRFPEDTRKALATHTNISDDPKSGLISISVTDHDPQRAVAMTQEYINELNWVVTHLSTSSAHRERVFLDQRLQEVSLNLAEAERQLSQFASQKGVIDVPSQGREMVTAAATLQGQLIAAESELQGLRQIYTDNDPHMLVAQARINELRSALQRIAGAGKDADQSKNTGELFPSIRQLPVLGVTYADLLRQAKVQEAVFATLTQQDELAKVKEAKEIPSVKVLDSPVVPQKKSFPPHILIGLLGGLLAFALSVVWVLARARWNKTDPADPRKVLAAEIVAAVKSHLPWGAQKGPPPPVTQANA